MDLRFHMRLRCCLVAALLLACTATAQEVETRDALLAPLPIRDQFLLSNGFLSFTPEGPRVLPEGAWSIALMGSDANTFAKSAWISHSLEGRTSRSEALKTLSDGRFQSSNVLFLIDGETHRNDLTLSRGIDHDLELRVSLPLVTTGGGWSDGAIESVHHALRLGNAERESLRRNSETVYLRHDGVTYISPRGNALAIGDVSLSAKYELTPMEERRTNLSLVTTVELPTGKARTLDGSGSVDAGVELVASRDYDRARINGSVALVHLGTNAPLGMRSQFLIADTVAVAYRVTKAAAVVAQLTVSESPFRQLAVPEFSRRSYQLSTGLQRRIGTLIVHAAFIENVVNFENSADAGVSWGISRRF